SGRHRRALSATSNSGRDARPFAEPRALRLEGLYGAAVCTRGPRALGSAGKEHGAFGVGIEARRRLAGHREIFLGAGALAGEGEMLAEAVGVLGEAVRKQRLDRLAHLAMDVTAAPAEQRAICGVAGKLVLEDVFELRRPPRLAQEFDPFERAELAI